MEASMLHCSGEAGNQRQRPAAPAHRVGNDSQLLTVRDVSALLKKQGRAISPNPAAVLGLARALFWSSHTLSWLAELTVRY